MATRAEQFMAAFPGLREKESSDVYIVFLEDGRRFEVPAVIYFHINQSGFSSGIEWRDAHPLQPVIEPER